MLFIPYYAIVHYYIFMYNNSTHSNEGLNATIRLLYCLPYILTHELLNEYILTMAFLSDTNLDNHLVVPSNP